MFEIIMYLGMAGVVISFIMIFIIPRNTLTNGTDMPRIAMIGFLLYVVSIIITIVGAFLSSELGMTIINAIK